MSPTQEHRVRTQALAVRWWLQMLELHHPCKTVLECAQLAREAVGYGACPDTIYRWGRMYATEGGFEADGRGDYERDLWIKQEDIELSALAWLRERKNLLHLSGESFAKFVNDELIPRHVGEGEGPERVKSLKEELSSWQLQYPVHPYTCTRWLHVLGGRFCEKTQTYMCDSHEKFKKDRDEYIKRDQGSATKPSDRELCQYQWVQMTEEAAERIYAKHNEEGVVALRKGAFSYPAPAAAEVDLNGWATISPVTPSVPAGGLAEAQPATSGGGGVGGRQMVEFHVESSDAFDEWRETQFMGGGLSVRMPFGTRPLIVSGQDEAIFNSEAATKRVWVIQGLSALTPKTGSGCMVSGFQNGVRGFGLPMTVEELAEVNEYRKEGGGNDRYVCGQFRAPQALCKLAGLPETDKKPPLKESPGVRIIHHGANKDGYWTYAHMMVQSEDHSYYRIY